MKQSILLIVLICFYNCITVSAEPLQGAISTDVKAKTKPLDPLLWTGNFFDEKAATALLKDESVNTSIWKKIPAWQAGDWETTQATNTKAVKYLNGQSYAVTPNGVYMCKSEITLGWQKDKNGDIWDRYSSSYWTVTEYNDYIGHSFIKFTAPGADEYPDGYSECITFKTDKSTNKILDVDQSKSWQRFVYLSPGLMKKEEVHTGYNEKGEPLYSAWNTSLNKQTKTFAENEIILANDIQLQQDFFNYLKNNGLVDLIPTGAGINDTTPKIQTTNKDLKVKNKSSSDPELEMDWLTHAPPPGEDILYWTNKIHLHSKNPFCYNMRGESFGWLRQYEKAIDDYSQAITLDPNDADAYTNRGLAYHALHQEQRAIEDYNRAINLDACNATTYANRAIVYQKLGEYEKVIDDCNQIITIAPKNVHAYQMRGDAYTKLGQSQKAEEDYNTAKVLTLKDPNTHIQTGGIFLKRGEYQKAIDDYTKAISLDPKNALIYGMRGGAYVLLGQYQKAIDDYSYAITSQTIGTDPNSKAAAAIYSGRAIAYAELGQYQKAIDDYSRTISIDPQNAYAYKQRSELYRKLGQHQKGLAI